MLYYVRKFISRKVAKGEIIKLCTCDSYKEKRASTRRKIRARFFKGPRLVFRGMRNSQPVMNLNVSMSNSASRFYYISTVSLRIYENTRASLQGLVKALI